jgi:nucleotide-binding universal stress UspA family protein
MVEFNRILVPIDFGETANHAAEVAMDIAAKYGAKVADRGPRQRMASRLDCDGNARSPGQFPFIAGQRGREGRTLSRRKPDGSTC